VCGIISGMEKIKYNKSLEEKIDNYVNGQLNDEEIEQLWGEVIHDPYYYDYMITAANIKKLNQQRKKTNVHKIGTSKRNKFYWMAAAASIAILIGVLSVVLFQSPNVNNGQLKPLNELSLKNVRSVEVLKDNAESQIKRGINLANSGKVQKALSLLESVKENNTKASIKASVEMNIGIINYNHKNYAKALNAFNNVISLSENNVLMREKAYWYAGNTYMQLGQLKKAQKTIRKAYNLNGAYRRIAGKYLKRLNKELSTK